MALINCKECGNEISDTAEFCPCCGYKEHNEVEQSELKEQLSSVEAQQTQQQVQSQQTQQQVQLQTQNQVNPQTETAQKKSIFKNKVFIVSIIVVAISLIIGIVIAKFMFDSIQESKKPIRVNISMTSYYGYIDDILDELDLDFDLVTAGANCYTGVQKSEFHTKKYGILHTEFRYCKSNKTQVFRVYNDENDQPLRDPKPGELATFDKYGEKISSSNSEI